MSDDFVMFGLKILPFRGQIRLHPLANEIGEGRQLFGVILSAVESNLLRLTKNVFVFAEIFLQQKPIQRMERPVNVRFARQLVSRI